MRTLLAIGALLLAAPPAAAAIFHAEGSYLMGTPVGYSLIDACGNQRATEGIDSSCIDAPPEIVGLTYVVRFSGTFENGGRVCFYDDIQFISCHTEPSTSVPFGTRYIAFCSFMSVQTDWVFDV